MTGIREPSASDERGIAERSAYLKDLLDAARESGLSGYAAYLWDRSRPFEPCIVVADVHVHCDTTEEPCYVIGSPDPRAVVPTNRIDLALNAIRDSYDNQPSPDTDPTAP